MARAQRAGTRAAGEGWPQRRPVFERQIYGKTSAKTSESPAFFVTLPSRILYSWNKFTRKYKYACLCSPAF